MSRWEPRSAFGVNTSGIPRAVSCTGRITTPPAATNRAGSNTVAVTMNSPTQSPEPVFETERLVIRRLTPEDAEFMYRIWNDPDFIRFVGDRGVRTLEGSRESILRGPVEMYRRYGFRLFLVQRKEGAEPIGICGLLKRDVLEDVDIGFAFLPPFRSQGYAFEAASAVMRYGAEVVGLRRIVAITASDNERSARLLERLGLRFERMIRMPDEDEDIRLFAWNA